MRMTHLRLELAPSSSVLPFERRKEDQHWMCAENLMAPDSPAGSQRQVVCFANHYFGRVPETIVMITVIHGRNF